MLEVGFCLMCFISFCGLENTIYVKYSRRIHTWHIYMLHLCVVVNQLIPGPHMTLDGSSACHLVDCVQGVCQLAAKVSVIEDSQLPEGMQSMSHIASLEETIRRSVSLS